MVSDHIHPQSLLSHRLDPITASLLSHVLAQPRTIAVFGLLYPESLLPHDFDLEAAALLLLHVLSEPQKTTVSDHNCP